MITKMLAGRSIAVSLFLVLELKIAYWDKVIC